MRRVAGIAVLVFLATAISVTAQNGPDNDPDGALGYVNNVFHQGQVDSINLYNGQLTVPISLGPSYSVGPKLKVQAMLVYGSRVFDYGHPPVQSPDHTFQPLAGDPALGIGWTFTFGAIKKCPDLCFIAADGSRHLFEYPVQGTGGSDYKTTDASPLYLHTLPGNGGYQMWDGDGNRYDMTWQVSGFDDVIDTQQQTGYTRDFGRGRDGWYARVVADPYGNSFSVDYYDTAIDGITFPCWTYDDINCTTGNYVTQMLCSPGGKTKSWIPKTVHIPGATIDVNLDSSRRIGSIDFPVYASGGATTKATWSFTYDTTPVSWECRYMVTSKIEMQRLTAITLPLSLATYGFQYGSTRSGLLTHIDLPTGGDLDYCYDAYTFFHGRISHMEPGCSQQGPDPLEAVLTSTTEFYCAAAAPEPVPDIPGGCKSTANVTQYTDTQVGVVSRQRTVSGGTPAITHYTQYAFPWGEKGDATHTTGGSQSLTIVVSPADNDGHVSAKAVLFYSGPKNTDSLFHNGDRTGADVQERIFDADPNDGSANMPACGGTTEAKYCASKAKRVTTRTYDYDIQTSEVGNRRLSSETVCYGSLSATGACSTTTSHKVAYTNTSTCPPPSGTNLCVWDGDNGRHYNQEKHTDGSGASLRTIVTAWTPKQWTGTPPANTAALPSLSTSRVTTEGSYVVDERPEYRSSDGFQLGTLIWDHASPYFAWLHCRYDDGNGSPGNDFTATYSGFTYGDPNHSPPATPCQTVYSTWASVLSVSPFGGGDAFGKGRTFQNGLLLTSRWFDSVLTSSGPPAQYSQQALGWYLRNYSREAKTGWITSSSDTGGQSTTYQYDVLGRVKSVTPPGETAISVSYDSTTKTTVTRGSQTWEQYIYDGLGRLVREINQTGASAYAVRTHGFDGPGREFFTSEWGNCTSATGDCTSTNPLGTTSSNYDPFGRPQAVTGPSNATYVATSRTDSSILYSDTKEAVSTCVNGPWSGSACSSGSLVTTTTVKDLFGRVKSVTDPAGGLASYTYDVNDKLRSVSQGAQSRTFTYNAFGYLTQEVTPEKGTVRYFDTADNSTRHGSLGNPRILIEGTSPSQVSHAYAYDGAGRLAQDTVGTTRYLLNCYDGSGTLGTSLCKDGSANFNGGSASGGKVTRRVGANPQFTPLYPSTTTTEFAEEDFTYAGAGGRVSKKSTLMLGLTGLTIGGASKASETWVYNTLGLVFSHTHPRVGGVSNQFLETFGYTNGRLSSLTVSGKDYDNTTIPSITITPTFRAAGNLGSYTTQQFGAANSLVTIVYQDTSGIPRPRQIQGSVNGSFLFDTGNITYDAAGNILTMGTDAFSYDTLSRLLSANLGTIQSYTYDGFGNLLTKAGTTFCTTTCANNKLTSGTYDTRGNMTGFGGETLTYDAENRQSKDLKSSITWQYLFSGADERLARVPGAAGGLSVPRREIARYIIQGKPFTPYTGSCTDGVPFADVHCTDSDFTYIYAISSQPGQANLTSGCGGGNYCPDTAVTRGQSAVLFMKAEHGSTFGPTCLGTYVDAPCSDPTSAFVEVAITEGVLFTCSSGHACPGNSLTELDAVKGMADGNLWPSYKPIAGGSLYTLRDNDNHVITEMADSLPSRDNVYVGNVAVASYLGKQPGVAGAWRFHSSDHLGTVRLTVDGATVGSGFLEQPKYWPYGELLTPAVAPAQRVGFAAMERDTENNHFYDHARHHDFSVGRFLSPDRIGGKVRNPQSWNRYAYSLNNPLKYVDPNGLEVTPVEVVMKGGARAITYVDSRIVNRLAGFSAAVTSKGFRLEFKDVFRTPQQQKDINTPYTKNTIGTSPHEAGLAVDVNLKTTERLSALTNDARGAGLSPLKDQAADPVHFQASDLITRDEKGNADQGYKDLIKENQQQAQEYEQLRTSDPAAFDAQVVRIEPMQNCPQPNRDSPCSR